MLCLLCKCSNLGTQADVPSCIYSKFYYLILTRGAGIVPNKWILTVVAVAIFLVINGCSSLIGDNQLARISKVPGEEGDLVGAWKDAAHATTQIIKKDDSVTITLDNCFFGDLPDVDSSNEIAIVLEFDEDGEKITKVLGPIKGTADKSYINQLGGIIYGPKKLSSEFLKMAL